MGAAVASDDDEPMMDINTTPLIDVMLVLLIMFIITIPPQTHAVKIDLPVPSNAPPPEVDPVRNKIFVDEGGTVIWTPGNGAPQPIDYAALKTALVETTTIRPVPELHIEPHPNARYEIVDRVLAVIKDAKVESMGFVGNEQYAVFK